MMHARQPRVSRAFQLTFDMSHTHPALRAAARNNSHHLVRPAGYILGALRMIYTPDIMAEGALAQIDGAGASQV